MDKKSITHRTLHNVLFSVIGFIWPVLLALILTPIIVKGLGIKEYGVYIFISTLISLVGLIEVGVSSALSKFISERTASKNYEGLSSLFKTANTILFCIGLLGALLIISTLYIGKYIFPDQLAEYFFYIPSFISAGIMFFINSIMTLYIVIPTALQRMDIGTRIGIAFFTFQQIIIVLGVLFNTGLNIIFLSLATLYLCFYFLYRKNSTHILPIESQTDLHKFDLDISELKKIYTFGLGIFTNNIAGSLLTYLDKAIIPIFVGPSNLTYYSLAGSIANKTPGLAQTFTSVIFPMAASFGSTGDTERIKTLYIRSTRLIFVISTSITITILSFPYKMLEHWISADVAEKAYMTLIILAFTSLILSMSGTLSNFLMGLGKVKQLTIASFSAATLNVILLFILLPRLGLIGAAWAYLLCLIPYIGLLYWTEYSFLNLTARKIHYFTLFLKLSLVSLIVFIFNQMVLVDFIYNFTTVLLCSAVSGILFITLYYLFGFFEEEDAKDILHFIKMKLALK